MPEGWFTEAEYRTALAFVMTPPDAARMAADLGAPVASVSGPVRRRPGGVPHQGVPARNLSEDTLILLSLSSADLAERVERFRATIPYGARRAHVDRAWRARRAELRACLVAGGEDG